MIMKIVDWLEIVSIGIKISLQFTASVKYIEKKISVAKKLYAKLSS